MDEIFDLFIEEQPLSPASRPEFSGENTAERCSSGKEKGQTNPPFASVMTASQ